MYWLRMYELTELSSGHEEARYIDIWTGPGFLNAVNRYYGYRVWR